MTVAVSPFNIRPLRVEEIGSLALCLGAEASRAQIENRWREQELGFRTVIVAEVEGAPVATVSFNARGPAAGPMHLFALEVGLRWRNRGIATALVRHVLDRAREEGRDAVYLEVRSDNRTARRLYHRLGFRRVGPEFVNTWYRFNDDGSRDVVEEASVRMVKRIH